MSIVQDTFDDLNSAFANLYEQQRNDSWFVEVQIYEEPDTPVLRGSNDRFDFLQRVPDDRLSDVSDIFTQEDLRVTELNEASLKAEGHILTPEQAASIARRVLTEVYGVSEDDLAAIEVCDAGDESGRNFTLSDILRPRTFRLGYAITFVVTIGLWLPFLVLLTEKSITTSVDPHELLKTAYSLAGYTGFIIALAVGTGAKGVFLYRRLPKKAASQYEGGQLDTLVALVIIQFLLGAFVGVVGWLLIVAGTLYIGTVSIETVILSLIAFIAVIGHIMLYWTEIGEGTRTVLIGAALLPVAIGSWLLDVIYSDPITGLWSLFILVLMFTATVLMAIKLTYWMIESSLQTYLEDLWESHTRYQAAKHRRERLNKIAPADVAIEADVEACNPESFSDPESALECLDRVHSELTQTAEMVEQRIAAGKEYESLKGDLNKLEQRAAELDTFDANISVRSYQQSDGCVGDYLSYLDSVRADLSDLEESIKVHEQLEKECESLQEYRKELEQRATPFSSIDIELDDISPTSVIATEGENADYQAYLDSIRTELDEYEREIERHERYQEARSQAMDLNDRIQQWAETYPDFPFDALEAETTAAIESASVGSAEELVNHNDHVEEVLQSTTKVLKFLDTVDLDHPSVDASAWRDAVNTALAECYPKIIRPIASDVDAMEDGRWEHEDLEKYTWEEFEKLIGSYYRSKGYDVEITQGTRDGGVDVWGTKGDERIAVQVKHYDVDNRIGRPTLQRIAGVLAKGDADRAIVVTNTDFTDSAVGWAKEFGEGLDLIDGDDLIDRLSRSNHPSPP